MLINSRVLKSLGEETVDTSSIDLDGAIPFARQYGGKRGSGKGYLQCWRLIRCTAVANVLKGREKGPNVL